MRTLTLAALAAAAVLFPVAAPAAEPSEDWRATACTTLPDMGPSGPPEAAQASGPPVLLASDRVPVDGLPGVMVGVDRLDFSGVTCEVLYVDGLLPRDAVLHVASNRWCAAFDRALDGVPQAGSRLCSELGSPTRLYRRTWPGTPRDTLPVSVTTFRPHGSEVLTARDDVPRSWVGKTFTTDHTGSTWKVSIAGTVGERHEFDRSRATDRAAQATYERRVARAARTFEQRTARIAASHRSLAWKAWQLQEARKERRSALAEARQVRRLALHGVRLVVRDFYDSAEGTLPAA